MTLDVADAPAFEFDDEPLEWDFHGTDQAARAERLSRSLSALTTHHVANCDGYRGIIEAMFPGWADSSRNTNQRAATLADIPFLPVGIFKERRLASFPESELFKTLTSSGTTGAAVSQVLLDRQTARRQTKALSTTMQTVLGPTRRPMLLVESEDVIRNRTSFSARAAGVVGMMSFGRAHKYLLDSNMSANREQLDAFLESVDGQRPLLFGFTFMVWQHLYKELAGQDIDLSGATLIHSGGWKKLEEERVSNEDFKARLLDAFGITEVVNFYGMAEQVGSVFLEGTDGLLHTAPFADVIIRNPQTWQEQPVGEPGLIQVLSAVPTGYPGHSILTEDLGVVEQIDSDRTPHRGKAFRVIGRVPKVELRGCSDTYASAASG
jgi:acyl-CoA synthetase (AMP-forming)/AMP-acid ligase II